jgi:hypothetical protein
MVAAGDTWWFAGHCCIEGGLLLLVGEDDSDLPLCNNT